jgi:cephalosporin hydroxylase
MTAPQFTNGQCLMQRDEIEALWTLVIQHAPRCVLEIGSYKGGSALVICEALRQTGQEAHLFMVDPCDQRDPALWERIADVATFIPEPSPEGVATASQLAGMPFDVAFVDGYHGFEQVSADLVGLLPVMRSGGVLVFHDAHFESVQRAIDEALLTTPLQDDGIIAGLPLTDADGNHWGGLRKVIKL